MLQTFHHSSPHFINLEEGLTYDEQMSMLHLYIWRRPHHAMTVEIGNELYFYFQYEQVPFCHELKEKYV